MAGVLVRLLRPATPQQRSMEAMLAASGGGMGGAAVTEEGALRLAAVYACVKVLAESVAMLPLILYEREGRGRRRAVDHPLYRVLHDEPNPLMSPSDFWEASTGHVCLWGNGYAEIEYDNGGRPLALWPLRPDQMTDVRRSGNELSYLYQLPDGKRVVLSGERVLHFRGLSPDGIRGYSVIGQARQLVGMGLAVEEFGSRFFRNGARPGGVLSHPGTLGDDGYERVKASWQEAHGGLSQSHRIAILEEGMSYTAVGVPPEEAQFLETMKFNRSQIASLFRVPPHMIGDLERATFSNIEQQGIEFKVFTMEPWLVRFQRAINVRLLGEGERERYFAEFLADALLRGDTLARYQAHSIGRQNGWLSANDIREKENMNPIEGGDVYLAPLNMAPAGGTDTDEVDVVDEEEGEEEEGRARPARRAVVLANGAEIRAEQWDAAKARHGLQVAYLPMYEDVAGRIVKRETNDIGNAARRLLAKGRAGEFDGWLDGFWEEHTGFVARQYRPLVLSAARQQAELAGKETGQEPPGPESVENYVEAYTQGAAERYVARRRAAVREWLAEQVTAESGATAGEAEESEADWEAVAAEFGGQLSEWREEIPAQVAQEESVRVGNALALAFLLLLGVTRKTWVTVGKNCPYCDSLSGRTIQIESFFLSAGQSFLPVGADSPLVMGGNVGHAPAHRGCDCVVVAG